MVAFEPLEISHETNQSIGFATGQRALKWLEKDEEKSNKREIHNNL